MPAIRTRVERSADYILPNVSCFDISSSPPVETQEITASRKIEAFATMLPNIEEIDISYKRTLKAMLYNIASARRKIRRIKCNGCHEMISMAGGPLGWILDSLTELYLDNSQLMSFIHHGNIEAYENEGQSGIFLLKSCSCLERLSIKNVSWSTRDGEEEGPVSQAMLIKMVRDHPTLHWLRSDLTQENIAMLQQERPEMIFVSE